MITYCNTFLTYRYTVLNNINMILKKEKRKKKNINIVFSVIFERHNRLTYGVYLFICSYPKSPATGLGTLALLAIIISEIFTSVATWCICCCKRGPQPTSRDWIAAQVCFVLSY